MKSRSSILCLTALAMIGVCAAVLARSQGMFRLGKPALRIVSEPLHDREGLVVGTHQVYLPAQMLDYQSESMPVTHLELDWLPKDTTYGRRRYFTADGSWLDLSVVLMGRDRTSIHKPEYCLPGQGFAIDRKLSEMTSFEIGKPHPYSLPICKIIASKKLKTADGREEVRRAVFVYWFVADGELTASHLQRMWWMGRDMIRTGIVQRWAYVSCLAVCRPGDEDATFERMKVFLTAAVPEFQTVSGAASRQARDRPDSAGPRHESIAVMAR